MIGRAIIRIVVMGSVALMASGCTGGAGATVTAEAPDLPPSCTPSATPPADPSPTCTLLPPTATPSPAPSPTPGITPSPGVTPTAGAVVSPIGDLNAGLLGQEVTVEGAVVATASFSAGFKFTLDDGTGRVMLLIWRDVYDDCWDAPGMNLGAWVRATGEVGEYEGVLQVEPPWGGSVQVLEPAAAWAEPRTLVSLSGADEGRRVMVEGEVVRTAGQESWVKVFVSDGEGEVGVFIWRNVLERVPDSVGLGTPGSRVRVVGTVQIYQSNLELVPTLPYDVVVLAIP